MLTDEAIRASLHARLDAGLRELQPPADLLSTLRRRQARRSAIVVGAVAAATVSTAVLAPMTVRAMSRGTSAPPPVAASGGTIIGVEVGEYTFELPAGLKVAEGPATHDSTSYAIATPTGRVGAPVAPAGEQPQRICIAMRPAGWTAPATTSKNSLLSCGASLTIFAARGPAAREANETGLPTFGDLSGQSAPAAAAKRRPVDVGRGTGWIAAYAQGRFVQVRVQLAPEESIEVFAVDLTEAQVVAMVRTALRR